MKTHFTFLCLSASPHCVTWHLFIPRVNSDISPVFPQFLIPSIPPLPLFTIPHSCISSVSSRSPLSSNTTFFFYSIITPCSRHLLFSTFISFLFIYLLFYLFILFQKYFKLFSNLFYFYFIFYFIPFFFNIISLSHSNPFPLKSFAFVPFSSIHQSSSILTFQLIPINPHPEIPSFPSTIIHSPSSTTSIPINNLFLLNSFYSLSLPWILVACRVQEH